MTKIFTLAFPFCMSQDLCTLTAPNHFMFQTLHWHKHAALGRLTVSK